MKTKKRLATLAICLAVLYGSRFGPYACVWLARFNFGAEGNNSSVMSATGVGLLLCIFLFPPIYDLISFATHRLGWEKTFDDMKIYPGEFPIQGARPISLKTKLSIFYPIELALVIIVLLPSWTKLAYCN
jgi:hypothetical protein